LLPPSFFPALSHYRGPAYLFPSAFSHQSPGPPLNLPSFPTRRSSDLSFCPPVENPFSYSVAGWLVKHSAFAGFLAPATPPILYRSEEHTSELQSRENLVCRLLLEKKKRQRHIARTVNCWRCSATNADL